MYTASLYGGLASLLSNVSSADLQGKKLGCFSYGSGFAASFFSLRVVGPVDGLAKNLNLKERLASMDVVPVDHYVTALKLREENHNSKDYSPKGEPKNVWPGAYYLEHIDGMFRRSYKQVPLA